MSVQQVAKRWAREHPDVAELGTALLASVAVVAIAIVQWGSTVEGWARGASVGLAMGMVVLVALRRGRMKRQALERAAAERRLQLARELHDAVAGQVSLIGIQAAAGRRVLADQPARVAEALEVIEDAARAANADLRRMLSALRDGAEAPPPVQAPVAGLAQLPSVVAGFGSAGLRVDVAGLEELPRLSPALDVAAFRIIQEALTNALAHAGPGRASVTLERQHDFLAVIVENDPGKATIAHHGSGLGLSGMRERAAHFGGTLDARPRPDGGFVVRALIPLVAP